MRRPVHPRACGEQTVNDLDGFLANGSSPRMRGTGRNSRGRGDRDRFIPAHAGNSYSVGFETAAVTVHPRACGEQSGSASCSISTSGSSPRMRGTGALNADPAHNRRFIPAHAGNRCQGALRQERRAVHPRACGEQSVGSRLAMPPAGSSPRMRGTARRFKSRDADTRFIPAHAGNRDLAMAYRRSTSVHPRACGEQANSLCWNCSSDGSSPRMRGTAGPAGQPRRPTRFIPAHAGNRSSAAENSADRSVHPRACGEQVKLRDLDGRADGSSPRMRGTVWLEDIGLSAFLPCQRAYRS